MPQMYDVRGTVNEAVIDQFEGKLGPLPAPYKAFIRANNGGCPLPPVFAYHDPADPVRPIGVEVVEQLYPFNLRSTGGKGVDVAALTKDGSSRGHGVQSYFESTEHFPKGLFAVGICTMWRRKLLDGYILLSVRPEDYGRVYLFRECKNKRGSSAGNNPYKMVFQPANLYPVAPDFDAFLAGLHWLPESEPWMKAVEFGDVLAMQAWIDAGGDVDKQCPALRLNALEFACMGNIFTPRSERLEMACAEMAALLAPRSSAPEAGLEWAGAGYNWLRVAAVIPHVKKLGTLKRVRKELQQQAGVMPLFTTALTEAGKAWAAQLPQLQDILAQRIRQLS